MIRSSRARAPGGKSSGLRADGCRGSVTRVDRARRLVEEATNGRRDHAEAMLALDADLGRRGLDAALVLGEAERVAPVLAEDPGAASRPTGARGWLPLLYVTHSAFLGGERTDGLLACARALLDAGADPDATWRHPEFGQLSALYGAAGVAHDPRMTALLLEAGASRDDGESVYHATETSDLACLRLLLEAGGRGGGAKAPPPPPPHEGPAEPAPLARYPPGPRGARARPRHGGPGEAGAAARSPPGPRGRALAAVGDLPRPLRADHPHADRARRRRRGARRAQRPHAVRPRLAHGPARRLRAAGGARRAA